MVGDGHAARRGLRQGEQAAFHGTDGHAGAGVGVDDAADIRPRGVDGAVDDVAGGVNRQIRMRIEVGVAVDVDGDQ